MELWGETLTFGIAFFLFLALAMALGFEFVNGFHDTARAFPNYLVAQGN
jgi:phosphate/sulfate permease